MRTLLGRIRNCQPEPNGIGRMVCDAWLALPQYYEGVLLDAFVCMPNHIHGIIVLHGMVGGNTNNAPDLSDVMRKLKSFTGYQYSKLRKQLGALHLPERLWQRSYWDGVPRDEKHLEHVRAYIHDNPRAWEQDERKGQPPDLREH
jgi:putative transposase